MDFGKRLQEMRNNMNMSDVDLAYNLGVERQTIEDWESGAKSPDLNELKKMAELFNVPVTLLVDDGQRKAYTGFGMYEYKSEKMLWGLPLVHIKSGGKRTGKIGVAKGIIAIGDAAVGVVAIGGVAVGVVSVGGMAIGGLALGGMALGLAALGGMAIGGIALGGMAVGYLALGGAAFGINAIGGSAIARDIALGEYAKGTIAIGQETEGKAVFGMYSITIEQFRLAVDMYLPRAQEWVVRVFERFLG